MSNIDAYTKKRDQSIASLKETFGTLRAGRVSAALLDNVKVDLYGERSPIKYGATISVLSPTDLQVRPFDVTTLKGMVGGINKARLPRMVMPSSLNSRHRARNVVRICFVRQRNALRKEKSLSVISAVMPTTISRKTKNFRKIGVTIG